MKKPIDMLQQMDAHVRNWQQKNDQRQVFLSCYRMMTANMLLAIEENKFHDREWVSKLLHHFADYYFEAVVCYDCGNNVPLVWQEVHEITIQNKLLKVQSLMIGVNAHINYDLVLALYDLLQPDWNHLSATERENRYRDHCKVNDIIAATIDKVQDEILEPSSLVMRWIDVAFGRLDEYLLSRLITNWRQDVWDDVQQMLAIDAITKKEIIRQNIEQKVLQRGKYLSLSF